MRTSKEIRDLAKTTYGDGTFQILILEILADMTERLEYIRSQHGEFLS